MTTSTAILVGGFKKTGNLSSATASSGQVIRAEFSGARPLPIPNTVSLESLIAGFESDPEVAKAMQESRRELAGMLYSNDPETLTVLRLSAGMSQARLSSLIGTSQSHIARIEAGRVDPSTEMVAKIAFALSISVERVFAAIRRQLAKIK
jgi:DNA-binding XRE family transcriptional regulator